MKNSKMIKKAIILAGGLGTRLRSVIGEIPKPMADINGKPFLEYFLDYLIMQGIEKICLSVGYNHQIIQNYFKNGYKTIEIIYSIEDEPLGTGGAVKKAINLIEDDNIFIFNGDTFFNINLKELYKFHVLNNSILTIAMKHIKDNINYGSIVIDNKNKITNFKEKIISKNKLINGGIYLLNKNKFITFGLPDKFSFEKDFLEKVYATHPVYGLEYESYFIDIGIPDNYERAKQEISKVIEQ